jgi:hypothetical protein
MLAVQVDRVRQQEKQFRSTVRKEMILRSSSIINEEGLFQYEIKIEREYYA